MHACVFIFHYELTEYTTYCSVRVLLHKSCSAESSGRQSPHPTLDDLEASRCLVRQAIKESLTKLEEKPVACERSIRWELGSCWLQHLQKQETPTQTNSKSSEDDTETEYAVKGLGKEFKFLKKKDKKPSMSGTHDKEENETGVCCQSVGTDAGRHSNVKSNSENELKKLISEEAFLRLKESGTGLHLKVSASHLFPYMLNCSPVPIVNLCCYLSVFLVVSLANCMCFLLSTVGGRAYPNGIQIL